LSDDLQAKWQDAAKEGVITERLAPLTGISKSGAVIVVPVWLIMRGMRGRDRS
jgi:hypothetical protein